MKVWINGEFKRLEDANVSLLSHSFGRGSAIFEFMDIVPAKGGPAYFGLKEHIDRLFRSADLVYMDIPMTKDEILDAFIETAKVNNITEGASKIFCYLPEIELTIIPSDPKVNVAIITIDYTFFDEKKIKDISRPMAAGISTFRKLHPDTVPVHAKVVANYVNGYLAKMEVKKRGYDDVIMLDTNGYVAEGATSNTFFVKDGRILTPKLDNTLSGITRMCVLELAKDLGIAAEETDIGPDELPGMDEAFYTGSFVKILPMKSIEGKKIGDACPGPVTSRLISAIKDIYTGKNEKFTKWLTYIK
jgi:branched-chain amino acid aminotransferase